jgi:predicted PurR-regulated permease PerM
MAETALQRPAGDDTGSFTSEKLLLIVLIGATVLAFTVCFLIIAPFVPALTWALALAVIAYPVHDRIATRIRNGDLAAALSVVLLALVVIAPLIFIGSQIINLAAEGVKTLQDQIESGAWRTRIEANPGIAGMVHWVEQQVNLRDAAVGLADGIRSRLGGWVTGTAWTIMQLFIALFALFFFFRDRREILGGVRSLIPLSNREINEVFARVAGMIRASVFGTVMVSLAQGTLGGLMFWILGLPAPAFWALVMSLFALIPTLGAPVVWAPAAALLAAQGSWGKALILVAWGVLAVGLIDNLLYPMLVGREMRLHTLAVFFAVVGGLFLFGASGIVLGPVALALTLALVDILRRRTAHGRSAEAPT